MIGSDEIHQVVGSTAYDSDGDRIGTVGQVYVDDVTGDPTWATVDTGLFGTSESFVPLQEAALTDDGLFVAYAKDTVKDAPHVADEGHLSPEEEERLYEHYGLDHEPAGPVDEHPTRTDPETSRPDDGAMTRSEERLNVTDTQRHVSGKARLRKYVETEEVQVTVPVRKEKVVLETVDMSDDDRADDGGEPVSDAEAAAFADAESPEVVVHQEVPVVTTEVQAVERVRIGKEQVTEEQQVTEQVRKERIIAEGDGLDGRDTTDTAR